jgi:hypothetical protein
VLEYFSPISAYTTKTEYITIKEYVGGGGSVCPLTLVQSSEVSKLPIEETVVSDDTSSDDISPNPS